MEQSSAGLVGAGLVGGGLVGATAVSVNSYGVLASDLWRAADERRFFDMPHRTEFFADLGLRISERVEQLVPFFAGDDPSGEPRRCRDLRLRKAKKQAEELAYQELIFSQSVIPADELVDA